MTDEAPRTVTVPRRSTIQGAGALLLGALGTSIGLPTLTHGAPVSPHADDESTTRITFLTDSHTDPENAKQMAFLETTFAAIAADEPELVLHGGDVTEYGTAAEYEAYLAAVPQGYGDKLWHVPGNHEIRWDFSAYGQYRNHLHELNLEITAAGIQFLLLDPTVTQQEFGYWTDSDLAWLSERLEAKPAGTPTVLVTHYPMAQSQYFMVNPEALFAAIEGHDVHAILAGHTHRHMVDRFNGLLHMEGAAVKNAAQYYRLDVSGADDRAASLALSQVVLPDAADPSQQEVSEVAILDLADARGRRDLETRLRPRRVEVSVSDDGLGIVVQLARRGQQALTARASRYQQQSYAGSAAEEWIELDWQGDRASGTLDISALPPGEHRVNVEVSDGTTRWRTVERFTVEGTGWARRGQDRIGELVTGATVTIGDRVVVGSSEGLYGFDLSDGVPVRAWQADTGPVLTNSAAGDDLVVVGSSDGTVSAVDPGDGSIRWQVDLGHPVMSNPLVTSDDDPSVVVMAGADLVRLSIEDGAPLWRVTLPAPSAGRAAADGERIYLGTGDGFARAVDLATGEGVWEFEVTERVSSYQRLIYGPWTHQATLVDDDTVLIATVSAGFALSRTTGELRWQIDKSYLYTPAQVLADGDLLLIDEWGEARRVDPGNGQERWVTDRMVSRSLDAAPIIDGDRALVVGTMGDLAVLDLTSGSYEVVRQLDVSPVVSSPSWTDDTLVVAHLDGTVRTYRE